MTGTSYPELLWLTAPEIVVAMTALLVLVLDLGLLRRSALALRFGATTTVACIGCLLALLVLLNFPAQGDLAAGMLVVTPLTQLVQIALLVIAILVLFLVNSARFTTHAGEYCALMLFATTAMMLLVSTQNLLVIFISIEFLSLSLYILTAFDKQSRQSAQAGLTYFLFGGMSAGILLFGMSLLYGLSGSLALDRIAIAVKASPGDPLLTFAMVMVMAGFGFKIAAAPFHMWAPEVYQGAPTSSAALVASSSKVAGFFALFVVFYLGLTAAAGSAARGTLFERMGSLNRDRGRDIDALGEPGGDCADQRPAVARLLCHWTCGLYVDCAGGSQPAEFDCTGVLRHYLCIGDCGRFWSAGCAGE